MKSVLQPLRLDFRLDYIAVSHLSGALVLLGDLEETQRLLRGLLSSRVLALGDG